MRQGGAQQLEGVAPVHAEVVQRAADAVLAEQADGALEEAGELGPVHLARGHGEVAVAHPAEPAGVAADRHVVGRIGEDGVRQPAAREQRRVAGRLEGVAAEQAVRAELPEVAGPRHRRARFAGDLRDLVLVPGAVRRRVTVEQEEVDLGGLEAGELDLEAELDELVEGAPEGVAVPAGLLGQAVLGDGEGAALRRAQAGQPQGRHPRQAEPERRLLAGVAGEDGVRLVDQDRDGEAELGDRPGQLVDLLVAVPAGVARVGPQLARRPPLDDGGQRLRHRGGPARPGGFARRRRLVRRGGSAPAATALCALPRSRRTRTTNRHHPPLTKVGQVLIDEMPDNQTP